MYKAIKERLYQDVEFLTTLRPFRNYKNLDSLEKVCQYIKEQFTKFSLEVEEQKWKARDSFFGPMNEYKNIIASYNTEKTKRLIIGAHYDVDGDQPGADDNASAVAGLLETARLIAENRPKLDYRIDFVAYCLEEAPFYHSEKMGSYIHAKSLYDNKIDVIGMICYEMIGFFSDEEDSQFYPNTELSKLYPSIANFIIAVGVDKHKDFNEKIYSLMKENDGVDVEIINFPKAEGLAVLSDHSSYWKFGYNAMMVNDTSFLRNPHYHRATDTIETLNFYKMSEVVNSCYNAIVKM